MYSDCIQNVNIAGCAYSLANNPNSGRFEVNVGMVTPDKLTSSSHNGNQNVSLNSNCTVDQKLVAVASQHNVTMVGEVRPHHQCPFDHGRSKNSPSINEPSVCTVKFTNRYWQDTGSGGTTRLVFISNREKFQKFCYWDTANDNGMVQISDCTDVEVGYLEIVFTAVIPILFSEPFNDSGDPKLTYDNHMKDVWYTQTYGCSYTDYMEQLIDKLILQQDHPVTHDRDDNRSVTKTVVSTASNHTIAAVPIPPHIYFVQANHNHDVADSSKTIGFLNHKQVNFTFVGQIGKFKSATILKPT